LKLGTLFVPLGSIVEYGEPVVGQVGEIHFDRREYDVFTIADDADVEFAPLNVFLGQRGITKGFMNVQNAFQQMFRVAHERLLGVDTLRRFHSERFDEQGHV